MKRLFLLLLMVASIVTSHAQESAEAPRHEVLLETDSGNIRIELFNETPLHRDNFMVQTGDMGSKNAKPGQALGDTPERYSLPAEIHYPELLHRRGAVAAARESDDVNPQRKSSSTQFYIVWGIRFTDKQLDWAQERLDAHTGGTVKMSPAVRQLYKTEGGSPHLDGQYTVFGQVVDGLDVVDRIQRQPVDDNDRPTTDLRIRKAIVLK